MNKLKLKSCPSFKPINDNISLYRGEQPPACQYCLYFSSRNCGRDAADSIETDIDIF